MYGFVNRTPVPHKRRKYVPMPRGVAGGGGGGKANILKEIKNDFLRSTSFKLLCRI